MERGNRRDWREICEEVLKEEDSERTNRLLEELLHVLEEMEKKRKQEMTDRSNVLGWKAAGSSLLGARLSSAKLLRSSLLRSNLFGAKLTGGQVSGQLPAFVRRRASSQACWGSRPVTCLYQAG